MMRPLRRVVVSVSALLLAFGSAAALTVVAAGSQQQHASAGTSQTATAGAGSHDSLTVALQRVLVQNEELEKRLEKLSIQSSECMARLDKVEDVIQQSPLSDSSWSRRRKLDTVEDEEDDFSAPSAPPASPPVGTITNLPFQDQIQINTQSIQSLQAYITELKKKFRNRIKRNRDNCNSVKTMSAQSASDVDNLNKQVFKLQNKVNASVAELQTLGGIVNAQNVQLQQMSTGGGYTPASTTGGGATAKTDALEAQVKELSNTLANQTTIIKDLQDALNGTALALRSNSDRLGALENQTKAIPQLELSMTALAVWVNTTYLDALNKSAMMSENSSTLPELNVTLPTTLPGSLPNATVGNGTSCALCPETEAKIKGIEERLSALERTVYYLGDDNSNVTVNITTTPTNGTSNETFSTAPPGSLVSLTRSVQALAQTVQDQATQLGKTEADVAILTAILFEADASSVNGTNATASNASDVSTVPKISRLDRMEQKFLILEAALAESVGNDTNATSSANVTTSDVSVLYRLDTLERELFTNGSSRMKLLETTIANLTTASDIATNSSEIVEDVKNLTARLDALHSSFNLTQMADLKDKLEYSNAKIEDLANLVDDVTASLTAVANLTNQTTGNARVIEAVIVSLNNLTSSIENVTRRVGVLEDQVDDYQNATDNAFLTFQSLSTGSNSSSCGCDMDPITQALNASSTALTALEVKVGLQGGKIKGATTTIAVMQSQLDSVEATVNNLTTFVTQEINNINEGLDKGKDVANTTAQSPPNSTSIVSTGGSR